MRCVALFAFALLLAGSLRADVRDVGTKAPSITLQKVLGAPPATAATLESLRGQVVVLEFWGTWCPHCIQAIPHFNALVYAMKGKPVQFIAVTYEDEPTVSKFLKTTPIHGWIGLDANHATSKAYGIETADGGNWPLTVVIRPDGTIDARLCPYPTLRFPLTAANLQNLIDGKPSGLTTHRLVFTGDIHDDAGKAIAHAEVSARELITGGFKVIGMTQSDDSGRFRIDIEAPAVYFAKNPNVLEITRAGFRSLTTEDLRPIRGGVPVDRRVVLQRDEHAATHVTGSQDR